MKSLTAKKMPSCVRISNLTEVVVAPKTRLAPSSINNAKTQKAAQWRVLRTVDLHIDDTSVVVHPLDLESFCWTNGGIVQIDGYKLNEPRQLSQKVSFFMNVETQPNSQTNDSATPDPEGQKLAYSRVFSSSIVPRGHISIPRFYRWNLGYAIHERICVSMPPPHTLPIARFVTIELRPVVWWGKNKEAPASNRTIISDTLKLLESARVSQTIVVASFRNWVKAKSDRDSLPRAPLSDGSVAELQLTELGVSLDVSIHFNHEDVNSSSNTPNLYMLGSDILQVVFAPESINKTGSHENSPVCVYPPTTDLADNWNTNINYHCKLVNNEGTWKPAAGRGRNLSFSFSSASFYFYERYSFSMLGGMDILVKSCQEHMLAILLRGIGWKSGVEREFGPEESGWSVEATRSGVLQGVTTKGAAWGGGGGIGGLLVHGPSGSGKTHLVHALAKWCSTTNELSPSERPYVCVIPCGSLGGVTDQKKIKHTKATLALSFWRAFVNSPSVIILDDIDELVPTAAENDPTSGSTSEGMTLYLYSLMQKMMQRPPRHMHCYENNIAIVASCKSLQSLNPSLIGPDLFSMKVDMNDSINKYPF